MKKQLHMEKNWVIVKDDMVFHYETFQEATANNTLLNGHLMSKTYYENHYKKDRDVTKFSDIPTDRG
jgi:hypothetical protein